MSDTDLEQELRRSPHFRGLPADLIGALAQIARWVEFKAGEVVFNAGEPARAFYFVAQGGVKVYRLSPDGREQVLHHLGPGRSFAEAAVLTMPSFPAHAVATESGTRLVEIAGAPFRELFERDRRLAAVMLSSLCMWLAGLADRVEELSVTSAAARLGHYLLRLPTRSEAGVLVIELPMAKKELAAHLAITPETLSRVLRRWQDAGVVQSSGRRLEVLDERLLVAIADRDEGDSGRT